MEIRLFEQDGSELWTNDDPIIKIVGQFAVWADASYPTRETVIEGSEFGRKATWSFDGGKAALKFLSDALDELGFEVPRSGRNALDKAICLARENGFWIRRLARVGKEWKLAEDAADGIVWLPPGQVARLCKNSPDTEAEKILQEINRIENGTGFYAIYAAPVQKHGKSAWKIVGKTRLVAANIDENEDIDAIVNAVSEDDIRKAKEIS